MAKIGSTDKRTKGSRRIAELAVQMSQILRIFFSEFKFHFIVKILVKIRRYKAIKRPVYRNWPFVISLLIRLNNSNYWSGREDLNLRLPAPKVLVRPWMRSILVL